MVRGFKNGVPTGHDPFEEGVRARVQGLARSDCPYAEASAEACDWLSGWHHEALVSREEGPLPEQR